MLTKVALCVGLGVGVVTVVRSFMFTVREGERAVVHDRFRGRPDKDKSVGEGIHFFIPWLQNPFVFDISKQPHTFYSVFYTKDLVKVNATVRVFFHPDISHLPVAFFHQNHKRVLPDIGFASLNSVISKFSADELLSNRFHVSALMLEALGPRAKEFNLILDELTLVDISFSPPLSRALKQNLELQQELERAKMLAKRAEEEGASFMPHVAEGNMKLFWMRLSRRD
ncbi:prohibitin-3, mitochondrial-like [Cucurbita moschata]|uniref:Prohibitin n=2 Tax=Cucurbita TaxID=3660 RepID=A0A6J1FFY0_CUCMO